VAKFSSLSAQHFGISCIGLEEIFKVRRGPVLLSLKLTDNHDSELKKIKKGVNYLVRKKVAYDVFLHAFGDSRIEHYILKRSRKIFCGNKEIKTKIEKRYNYVILAWCPALIDRDLILHEEKINIFSFGIAHKIQVRFYKKVKELFDEYGLDYSLWVSTAFHEKANFGDFHSISKQLSSIFKKHIQFLGFLSDEAVNYFLNKADLFIAFFKKGLRANNTSVFAAMNRGCAVLTNLDMYSPSWIEHRINILDINQVSIKDLDKRILRKIGIRGKKDVNRYFNWQQLRDLLLKD